VVAEADAKVGLEEASSVDSGVAGSQEATTEGTRARATLAAWVTAAQVEAANGVAAFQAKADEPEVQTEEVKTVRVVGEVMEVAACSARDPELPDRRSPR